MLTNCRDSKGLTRKSLRKLFWGLWIRAGGHLVLAGSLDVADFNVGVNVSVSGVGGDGSVSVVVVSVSGGGSSGLCSAITMVVH